MRRNILIASALSIASAMIAVNSTVAADAAPQAIAPTTQPASDPAALIKQLGDDDFHVRQTAADALRAMGKSAIPALQDAKKSADPEIRGRAEEILGDIDRPPALPVPKPGGAGGTYSTRVSIINGNKSVDIDEPGRTIHVDEDANGIAMKVTGEIDGKRVTREYKAKTADQLKKENPEAFALYQRTTGTGGIQLQGGGNGIFLHGNVQINGAGGPIVIGPNLQPPIAQRIQPGADNLDQLESRVADQMKAANIPDAQQDEIKDMFKKMREAHQQPANNLDVDAQMREYNRQCDALRKKLSDLKLPDPGDALSPPLSGRLGISAMEETVAGQGLVVTHVLPDSRAEKIGLKEQDVIQKVNGKEVHSTRDLRKLVTDNPKGLVIEGQREGKDLKLEEKAEK